MVVSQSERREKLKSAINKKLSAKKGALGRPRDSVYDTEYRCICRIQKLLADHDIEVRAWQDGTRSDFGVRFNDADLWLPLQLKSTQATYYPFSVTKVKEYDMAIVFLTRHIKNGIWVIPPSALTSHNHRDLYIGSTKSPWNKYKMSAERFATSILCMIQTNRLFTEHQLRCQCNANSRVEYENIMAFRRAHPYGRFEWPSVRNGVFDHIFNGSRQQFKSAAIKDSGSINGYISKTMFGMKVPYVVGDCDEYVFVLTNQSHRVFWRFTEEVLLEHNVLTVLEQEKHLVKSLGQQSLQLCMPAELYTALNVRSPKRSNANSWTAEFCSVFDG